MEILFAILLGFVQGITEFLPISSSGHLVLLELIVGTEFNFALLNVLVHFATLFAVCFYCRKTLKYLILHPLCKTNLLLFLATIPAVLFVVLTRNIFDFNNSNFLFLGVGFLLTALFLIVAELCIKKEQSLKPLGVFSALAMGLGQAFAVFPGLSRSGTTFSVGVIAGNEKNETLQFSFLMSIPIILASVVYEIFFEKNTFSFESTEIFPMAVSCVTAFIFAVLGLKLMNKLVQKIRFVWFVPYLVILGFTLILL